MQIDAVDFFYLSMPEIADVGDGSQDALVVRVRAGQNTGWGECEAAPLVSIASWCCPMSHSACHPLADSVLGERLDDVADIRRINRSVRERSLDLLQADHTLSGIDIALWDLLGRARGVPVWQLLGLARAEPKTPYASLLFGDTPEDTFTGAQRVVAAGYRAAKFGWGPYGRGAVEDDAAQVRAAREGLGPDARLLVDAGTVWGDDVDAAARRLAALEANAAEWLEEPFVSGALESYGRLARMCRSLRLAGGEGCHNFHQAKQMIDHARIGYVQIDAGRIGGITTAWEVAQYARQRQVTYVNHTFTSYLALAASLLPLAAEPSDTLCEYPVESSELARGLTRTAIEPGDDGLVRLPEGPGLGIEPDLATLRRYLVETEIRVGGRLLYRTPMVD